MNRKQIKQKREFYEREIDRLMSRGYGGSDDPEFQRACEIVNSHEKELKKLVAASDEINAKSRKTRLLQKYAAGDYSDLPF